MLAGCAEARNDCSRWHEGGGARIGATLDQWAQEPVEGQLATAALVASAAFDLDDEHAWIAAAASIQECITGYARDRGD